MVLCVRARITSLSLGSGRMLEVFDDDRRERRYILRRRKARVGGDSEVLSERESEVRSGKCSELGRRTRFALAHRGEERGEEGKGRRGVCGRESVDEDIFKGRKMIIHGYTTA